MEITPSINNNKVEGRLVIDEEKLAILKFFFDNRNMGSTKKENLPVIRECASRTMLTEQQVKVGSSCHCPLCRDGPTYALNLTISEFVSCITLNY